MKNESNTISLRGQSTIDSPKIINEAENSVKERS